MLLHSILPVTLNLNSAVINSAPQHLYNPKIFDKLKYSFYLKTGPCTVGKPSISQQVQKYEHIALHCENSSPV